MDSPPPAKKVDAARMTNIKFQDPVDAFEKVSKAPRVGAISKEDLWKASTNSAKDALSNRVMCRATHVQDNLDDSDLTPVRTHEIDHPQHSTKCLDIATGEQATQNHALYLSQMKMLRAGDGVRESLHADKDWSHAPFTNPRAMLSAKDCLDHFHQERARMKDHFPTNEYGKQVPTAKLSRMRTHLAHDAHLIGPNEMSDVEKRNAVMRERFRIHNAEPCLKPGQRSAASLQQGDLGAQASDVRLIMQHSSLALGQPWTLDGTERQRTHAAPLGTR